MVCVVTKLLSGQISGVLRGREAVLASRQVCSGRATPPLTIVCRQCHLPTEQGPCRRGEWLLMARDGSGRHHHDATFYFRAYILRILIC